MRLLTPSSPTSIAGPSNQRYASAFPRLSSGWKGDVDTESESLRGTKPNNATVNVEPDKARIVNKELRNLL